MQGIGINKAVITVMREEMADPARLLASTSDFFGDALDCDTDTTLNTLLKPPVDIERFSRMMQTDLRDDNGVGAAIQSLL